MLHYLKLKTFCLSSERKVGGDGCGLLVVGAVVVLEVLLALGS
ncbi:hypothetical protein [Bradyrhizobium sp. WD16]|nr:hypothetical protein [Bradyrhizobium sp. WD16]